MHKYQLFALHLLVITLLMLQTSLPLFAVSQHQTPQQDPDKGQVDTAGNRVGGPVRSPTNSSAPVVQGATKIICYTSQVDDSDPCARIARIFGDVTIARDMTQVPEDLSPYEVFYLGFGEGHVLDGLASRFFNYVENGGGLVVEQPNVEGTIELYPPGFEMTVTNNTWPGFPTDSPGPVEFTAAGVAHPILSGLTPADISGNYDTVPLSLLGPGWTVLVKSVEYPHVALAVGHYGAGRLLYHSGNTSDNAYNQGSDAYIRQMIEWAGADNTPGANMGIDAIEVTQAVQDLNNSVDLVANKRTYVRVHASSPTNATDVFANLSGAPGGATLFPTLSPGNPGTDITVRTVPNRGLINDSFWFELPYSWTNAGSLTLTARLDPADAKNDPDRSNNTRSVTVNFLATPPLRLRLFDVRYTVGSTTYLAADSHLNQLESWLRRAYPISDLQVSRQTFDYPDAGLPDVDTLHGWLALGKILNMLYADEDNRIVYYAMVDDGGGFMRGKALGIPGTIAAGPTGSSTWGWDNDGSYGDWYGAHEIGHTRNRYHAEFCGAGGGQSYPYSNGLISPTETGATALFGFDIETRAVYGPSTWRDVMTYCTNQWISDFTYEGIRDYTASEGADAAGSVMEAGDRFLVVMGMADLEIETANLESVYVLDETEQVPVPNGGDWILALQDADGNDLKTYAFTPMELTDGEEVVGRPAVIALIVPAIEGLAKIEIRVGSQVVATRNASATAPVVQITLPAPEQGSVHTLDTLDVAWTASDADGDPLSFSVLYSNDDGATWQTQVTGLTENHYTIDSSLIPGGNNSRVRVLASDGFLGGEAISAPFFIPRHAPQVLINSPVPLATFWPGQSVVLNGSAYDLEDGTLSGSSLIWSSSIDGFLGTGTISDTVNLSTGDHVISLTATDSNGMQRSTQVNIAVVGGAAPEPILIQSSPNALSHIVFEGGAAATLELALGGSDDSSLAWEASADHAWIRLNATSGTLPAQFEVTIAPAGLDVGSYKGIITIAAEGAANAPLEIPVVLEVMQRPTLSLAPGALQYTVVANGEAGEFEINLGSSNDTSLNWQASANTPWISLDPAAGVVPATLVVRILPDGLDPDTYHGVISVAASPAGNSPATIPVTLTVKPVDMYLPFLRGTK